MMETIEELENQYRGFAASHGAATLRGDYRAANKSHDMLVALVPKMRLRGSDGEAVLMRLTQDQNETVACWAATHSLPFAEDIALNVLDTLSKRIGPIGFNAKMVIQLWKNGQLIIP